MLPDPTISIAGHAVTAFQLLATGALLLCAAAIMLAYRRELKLSMRRSSTTDELFDQMVRIANALERLANHASNSVLAEPATRRAERAAAARGGQGEAATSPETPGPAEEPVREEHHVAYSMFGR